MTTLLELLTGHSQTFAFWAFVFIYIWLITPSRT
jgi:hypothetical protein